MHHSPRWCRRTGWKYQQVNHGADDGFQSASFDDSTWATGQAAFGSVNPPSCTFNDPSLVHTNWDLNTDMLIRRHFKVPEGVTSLHTSMELSMTMPMFI
jgi:hypothetical protein